MRYFSIFARVPVQALAQALVITLIVSACGARVPQATPAVNPAYLQITVVAAAFTGIAETMAALPTATPPPPTATATNTAAPTNTFVPFPSTEAGTPLPNSSAGGEDPCVNKPLPATLQGKTVRVRIDNTTQAALAVSVYLNSSESQSQCGYRTYTLARQESLVLNDLVEGCYTFWAWNPIPEDYFIVTNGTSCLDDSQSWQFDISTSSIKLK